MFIDIVDIDSKYRGIQRTSETLFRCNIGEINKYLNLFSGERIEYSKSRVNNLLNIAEQANSEAHSNICEVILFGKNINAVISKNYDALEFLGFDVSGDSMYLSPIKTVFYENSITYNLVKLRREFGEKLNSYGLFSDEYLVESFCDYLNEKSFNELENDGLLFPIKVYKYKMAR